MIGLGHPVPADDADWHEIAVFGHTFDGYKFWGSFEKCAQIANRRAPTNLVEARTCLFFEHRRWRHFGECPDAQAREYVRWLVEQIHGYVRGGTESGTLTTPDSGTTP